MGPQQPAPGPGIAWSPEPAPSSPTPTGSRRAPQSTAVIVLCLVLAALVVLWVAGALVLWHFAPALDTPLSGSSATATSTR